MKTETRDQEAVLELDNCISSNLEPGTLYVCNIEYDETWIYIKWLTPKKNDK